MIKFLVSILVPFINFATARQKDPSIIVIGAGPSGLAATTRLLENNFQNIVILEAEPRIGGRVNTIKFGDAYLDLGAEWCHGQKDNVVYTLTRDLNIFRHSEFEWTLYHSSGKLLEKEFSDELQELRESIQENSYQASLRNYTIGDYFLNKYQELVNIKYRHDREKLDLAMDALHFYVHIILSMEGAFSLYDLAIVEDYKEAEGDQQLNWNGRGYRTILDILMKKYPDPRKQLPVDQKLNLNKEVVSIGWDQRTSSVQVSCKDGTAYKADHLIFTPSVGVLKDRASNLFSPSLPLAKMEAIKNIGLGAVIKVVMLFSSKWWGNEANFNLVWSEQDRRDMLRKFPEDPTLNGKSWLTNLCTIVKVEKNPRVLVAWFTGEMVPAIEVMPEETLIKGLLYTMNKFLGNTYRITDIEKIKRTQWYSNPHFRGTWSFQTVNSKRGVVGFPQSSEDDLAEPINDLWNRPLIQFAGEATNPYHYGTVHGAIETGYREADRLIELYT